MTFCYWIQIYYIICRYFVYKQNIFEYVYCKIWLQRKTRLFHVIQINQYKKILCVTFALHYFEFHKIGIFLYFLKISYMGRRCDTTKLYSVNKHTRNYLTYYVLQVHFMVTCTTLTLNLRNFHNLTPKESRRGRGGEEEWVLDIK